MMMQSCGYLVEEMPNEMNMRSSQGNSMPQADTCLETFLIDVSLIRACPICSHIQEEHRFTHFCCNEHTFCIDCIHSIATHAINDFRVPKCPVDNCHHEFTETCSFFEVLSKQHQKRFSRILRNREVLSSGKIRLCFKPDCKGSYQTTALKLICNICQQQYCQKCHQTIHQGPCDRSVARGMQRIMGFRRCPQCRMVVERMEGCDHMTCYCNHQFCYKCGRSYVLGTHICKAPPHLKGLSAFRWNVEWVPTALETERFNLKKVLYFLELTDEASVVYRLVYTLLFILLAYPVLVVLLLSLYLFAATLFSGIAIVTISLYFLILPIIQVINLQLSPAIFLRNKNVPQWLVRVLVLPMYPINFLCGIKERLDLINCQAQIPVAKSLLRIIGFILTLPFLINTSNQ